MVKIRSINADQDNDLSGKIWPLIIQHNSMVFYLSSQQNKVNLTVLISWTIALSTF